MITSDLKEINLDDLNPYEGDISLLLTENSKGLWKKLVLDPDTVVAATNVLTLVDNKIVSTPASGGGAGNVELVGAVTGLGPVGAPVTTSLSTTIDIETDTQTFDLNASLSTTFNYEIQDGSVDSFSNRFSKGEDFVEITADFSETPTKAFRTSQSGKFTWSTEIDISQENTNDKFHSDLSGDFLGNAFAIWTEKLAGNDTEVRTSIYDSQSGQWGASSVINTLSEGAASCKISSNASGDAIAAWTTVIGGNIVKSSNYNSVSQLWSAAISISASTIADGPELDMNDSGEGIIVWEFSSGSQYQLKYSIYDGVSWSAESSINSLGFGISNIQVALDSSGNAVVTYLQLTSNGGGDPEIVRSSTYDSGTQLWSAPVDISNPTLVSARPDLSFNKSSENAICVWNAEVSGTNFEIQYATYDGGTKTWSSHSNVSTSSTYNLEAKVSLDPLDNAICIWREIDINDPDLLNNYTVSNYNGTSWAFPKVLYSSPDQATMDFVIGINSDGNGIALSDIEKTIISVSYNSYSQNWSNGNRISPRSDFPSADIRLLVNDDDTAMVTWVVDEGTSSSVLTSDLAMFTDELFCIGANGINFNFNRLQNIGIPGLPSDGVNKEYVDNLTAPLLSRIKQLESLTANLKNENPDKKEGEL